MATTVKSEKWKGKFKGKRVIVARIDGKIATYTRSKKFSLATLKNIFKKNGTFDPDIKQTREKLSKVTEHLKLKIIKKEDIIDRVNKGKFKVQAVSIRGKRSRFVQYVVEGTTKNGVRIIARSRKLGQGGVHSSADAVNDAWEGFFSKLDQHLTGDYDAGDGRDLFENANIVEIREGWVWYE